MSVWLFRVRARVWLGSDGLVYMGRPSVYGQVVCYEVFMRCYMDSIFFQHSSSLSPQSVQGDRRQPRVRLEGRGDERGETLSGSSFFGRSEG
jgi:hypothetical protein